MTITSLIYFRFFIFKDHQIEPFTLQNIITEPLFNQNKLTWPKINSNETQEKSPNEKIVKRERNNGKKIKIKKANRNINQTNLEKSQHVFKIIEEKNKDTSLYITPHPPIQFPKPISSKFRKKRPLKFGKYDQKENFTSQKNKNKNDCFEFNLEPKSRLSNSFLDESINDLIRLLKSNSNKNDLNASESSFQSTENFSEFTNIDDSGKTIIYSFSSKPKPLSFVYNEMPYLSENFKNISKVTELIKSQKNKDNQQKNPCVFYTNDYLENCK